jgi:hypothetical protein
MNGLFTLNKSDGRNNKTVVKLTLIPVNPKQEDGKLMTIPAMENRRTTRMQKKRSASSQK